MGPCLSPGATVREYPLGHQPGTIFGLERAIPKGPILASKGPFLVPRDCFGSRGQIDSKKLILHRKVKDFYFLQDLFGTRSPS